MVEIWITMISQLIQFKKHFIFDEMLVKDN